MIYWISRFFALLFYKIFYPHKIFGKENLIKNGKCIVVCNHYGKIDVAFITALFTDKMYFLGKKEWFKHKFSNWLFRKYGGIPVDRDRVDFESMKACFKILNDNKRLGVFPEGTRNRSEEGLLPLKGGAGLIAFKCKAPMVPVVMRRRFRIFHKNYAYIGKPFDFEQFAGQKSNSELNDKMTEIIRGKLLECKAELNNLIAEDKKKRKGGK